VHMDCGQRGSAQACFCVLPGVLPNVLP
jgi:hypothetical protein